MAQLQHNMLVADAKKSVLSIINGGGKWVEISIDADPIYQTILIAAEKTGRRARAIELDPRCVDVAIRRWEQYTGKIAVLLGRSFLGWEIHQPYHGRGEDRLRRAIEQSKWSFE
jgi:DNA modification methylase